MDVQEKRIVQSFRRSLDWNKVHPELRQAAQNASGATGTSITVPAASSALATQVETLHGVVSRIEHNAAVQDAQKKRSSQVSTNASGALTELRKHQMRPIVEVAHSLRSEVPGISGALKMPKSRADAEAMVAAANAMAQNAAVYKDVLIEHGLPHDFIDQLNAAAEAVKQSVDARGAARVLRKGATKSIKADIVLGRNTVGIMNAAIARLLRNSPGLLAEWENAKRVTVKGVPTPPTPAATAHQGAAQEGAA